MATVHMMIGIPGSGKTTFARSLSKEHNYVIVSSDVVRMLHPDFDETKVWPEVYRLCAENLKNNQDIIFDATNITPKVRARFDTELSKYHVKYQKIAYFFKTDVSKCIERVTKRNTLSNELYLPTEVISSYGEKIIPPTTDEGFIEIKIIENNQDL